MFIIGLKASEQSPLLEYIIGHAASRKCPLLEDFILCN
jgi:hypothetical protein